MLPNTTEVSGSSKSRNIEKPVNMRSEGRGVILPICKANILNDTSLKIYNKPFLAPLDIQKAGSIAGLFIDRP